MKTPAKALAALAFLALAACDMPAPVAPADKGAAVPIREVLARHAGQFECAGYNPASDSCEGLGRSVVKGNTIHVTTLFALDEGTPATITLKTRHPIDGNRSCGLSGPVQATVKSEGGRESAKAIEEMFEGIMGELMADVCATYYESGTGYYVEATTRDGIPLPELSGTSHFFPEQKKLRAMPLF